MEPAEPGLMVFHPGEFIADELVTRKLPVSTLVCYGWSEKKVNLLLQGKRRVDWKMASHIRTLWNWDTEFWFRLQVQWDAYPNLRENPPWPRRFVK